MWCLQQTMNLGSEFPFLYSIFKSLCVAQDPPKRGIHGGLDHRSNVLITGQTFWNAKSADADNFVLSIDQGKLRFNGICM